jgi:branched-subunit amino acid aminotransferase/4-amino-4-deoxychorismate lyase
MRDVLTLCWVDGRVRPRAEAAIRADDLAFTEGRGCYTTARIRDGGVRFVDRHLRRLVRGARALGLGELDADAVARCLEDLACELPDGQGAVRVQLSRDPDGDLHVVGLPRPLGPPRPHWTAIRAPLHHPGPILAGGHKLTNRLALALASDAAQRTGADEALLFDADGWLVEGARTNLVVADGSGALLTPPLSRGAVAGIALEVARERIPELREGDLGAEELAAAPEIVAINCVRGARPIVSLDGRPVGAREGPALTRLAAALERD